MNYKEAIYALLEYVAKNEGIENYNIYDFEGLLNITKSKINLKSNNKTKYEQAIYKFIKYLKYYE